MNTFIWNCESFITIVSNHKYDILEKRCFYIIFSIFDVLQN